jgi:transposase-like protein
MAGRYRAGESCASISAATALPRSTVYRWLKRAGVEMRPAGKARGYGRLGPSDGEIIDRYRGGASIRAIGLAMGISNDTVHGRLVEAGIARRRPGRPSGAGAADEGMRGGRSR